MNGRLGSSIVLVVSSSLTLCCASLDADEFHLELERSFILPNLKVDGQRAHIHTQGLYVDDQHIYATGRLEREPKRPLFLRLDRAKPDEFEVLDLSIREGPLASRSLDHPGGFDCDGRVFWIPLARSDPSGPSAIVRVPLEPDVGFEQWRPELVFQVDDHIGAIAYLRAVKHLYGANWDTKQIHVWRRDGSRVATIARRDWIQGLPAWSLAVQDWKDASGLPVETGTLIAGGIDKSPGLDSGRRAVIELYHPQTRQRRIRRNLPQVTGYGGPVTNEGMCVHDRRLILLPGDLGKDARLYFFRIVR